MQVNKMAVPSGVLVWHCVSQVSVEVTDATAEGGNPKFTCRCFRCFLVVRGPRGVGGVELALGKG